MINIAFREWGHQYLYTRNSLGERLQQAGFSSLVETPASGFDNAVFKDAQGHPLLIGKEMNDLEAFAIEATK
jgi:hypothetical protein